MENKIIIEFIDSINKKDLEKISLLMSEYILFIDAHGNEVQGNHRMKAGWKLYFEWFPDYQIEITETLTNGELIAVFGFASGTFRGIRTEKNENFWKIPASWKIKLENDKIALWQVFADTKIPYDIIAKNS
jgi:ketosteroid isomerase-like protein